MVFEGDVAEQDEHLIGTDLVVAVKVVPNQNEEQRVKLAICCKVRSSEKSRTLNQINTCWC